MIMVAAKASLAMPARPCKTNYEDVSVSMPRQIELSTSTRPSSYAPLSSDPPGTPLEEASGNHHGPGTKNDGKTTPSTNIASSGSRSTGPLGHSKSTSSGHFYSNVKVSDHGRMHAGNVYNYHNANQEDKSILTWLAPIGLSDHHSEACKQYSEGTLSWFFEDRRFRAWRDDEACQSSPIFWCQGEMGTGKTTLVSQVLQHLLARDASKHSVAVVYCRLAEQSSQSAEHILGLVLAQIYQNDHLGFNIPPAVEAAFKSQSRFWAREPSLSQLTDWLVSQAPTGGQPAFVLLDALDELHPLTRQRLLRVLESPALKRCPFRILMTSRHAPGPEIEPFSGHAVEIRAQEGDLQTLVNAKLSEADTGTFRQLLLRPARDPNLGSVRDEISRLTVGSARNMFLHACMHLNRIVQCTELGDIYDHLDNFPLDLDTIYEEAWNRATDDEGSPSSHRARSILMWVIHAERPFTVRVMEQALLASRVLAPGSQFTTRDILSSCAGLVHLEPPSTRSQDGIPNDEIFRPQHDESSGPQHELVVVTTHPSVHRYLDRNRESYFPRAHDAIVAACLRASIEFRPRFLRVTDISPFGL